MMILFALWIVFISVAYTASNQWQEELPIVVVGPKPSCFQLIWALNSQLLIPMLGVIISVNI